jgi:hypothetical protein
MTTTAATQAPAPDAAPGPVLVTATFTTRQLRKRDPRELRSFMARMLRSYGRRALEEDPGELLADMLNMRAELDKLISAAGEAHVKAIGPTQTAGDLTMAGHPHTKQSVTNKWGPGAAARRASQVQS